MLKSTLLLKNAPNSDVKRNPSGLLRSLWKIRYKEINISCSFVSKFFQIRVLQSCWFLKRKC